jgi:hypothetical protein
MSTGVLEKSAKIHDMSRALNKISREVDSIVMLSVIKQMGVLDVLLPVWHCPQGSESRLALLMPS